MNVISKYGVVLFVNGFSIPNLNTTVSNPVSETSALSSALQHIGASQYTWQDSVMEEQCKISYDPQTAEDIYNPNATLYPKGSLVIARPWRDTNYSDTSKYKLCYKFFVTPMFWDTILIDTSTIDTIVSYDTVAKYVPDKTVIVYVNAITGQVYTVDSNNYGSGFWVDCTVNSTSYDGNRTVQGRKTTLSTKRWAEDSRSINLKLNSGELFYVHDATWSGEHYKTGASAYWCIQRSWDYFHQVHGFAGPTGGRNRQNIYFEWSSYLGVGGMDMRSMYQQETPEIDKYLVNKDFSSLGANKSAAHFDILAHEYTHAMIKHKPASNGFLSVGHAGAIAEGFCDYFGMSAAIWGHYDRFNSDWINGWGQYDATMFARRFDNPTYDHYSSTYPLDPHASSGLLRKVLYLTEKGGTHSGISVAAMNTLSSPAPTWDAIRNAFITMYWWCWSNMNYVNLRNAFVDEYNYYYKPCSPKSNSMYRAWNSVGIGSIPLCARTWVDWPWVTIVTPSPNSLNFVSNPLGPKPGIKIRPTEGVESSDIVSYQWSIPQQWHTHFTNQQDLSEIFIDSVSDLQSRYFVCIVTYSDSTTDTITKALHFVNERNYEQKTQKELPKINNNLTSADVVIYPNPAENRINIILPFEPTSQVEFQLLDIAGNLMYSSQLYRIENSLNLPIISTGVYIVKIKGNNRDYIKRLVIGTK